MDISENFVKDFVLAQNYDKQIKELMSKKLHDFYISAKELVDNNTEEFFKNYDLFSEQTLDGSICIISEVMAPINSEYELAGIFQAIFEHLMLVSSEANEMINFKFCRGLSLTLLAAVYEMVFLKEYPFSLIVFEDSENVVVIQS